MEFNIFLFTLALVFSAIFLAVYGFFAHWNLRQKVRQRAQNPDPPIASPIFRQQEKPGYLKEKILGWLSSSGQWALKDQEKLFRVRIDLIQAGFRQATAPAIYFGLRVLFAFLLPVPFLLLITIKGKINPLSLLWAFSLSLMGFYLPAYFLNLRIRHRQARIDKALPDVMDLFVICMEAGLSLNASVHRVAKEIQGMHQDFHQELQITAAELHTGIPWDEAFENLGRRTGVQSVRSMVALMIQSEKMGTSLAQAFRTQSEFNRVQRALRSEEKAAKLPVKMLFPLVMLILPAMFIVSVGPALIHIKTIFRSFAR
jgi:tight adherence protein C